MRAMVIAFGWCVLFLLAVPLLAVASGDSDVYAFDAAVIVPWLFLVIGAHVLVLRWTQHRRWRAALTLAVPYLVAALVGGAIRAGLDQLYQRVPGLGESQNGGILSAAVFGAYSSVGVIGIWMLFYVAPRSIEQSRERERERQELLRDAERNRIRTTLEPHFVLNTLNAIAGLVSDDPVLARQMIGDLGDLLRDVVARSASSSATVADEVQWLRHYTHILEARHAGRLAVSWHVNEAARSCRLPVMLLQPIVENAIQHGALRRPEGGAVAITVERAGDRLRCVVADDGPGIEPREREPERGHGHGLELTRRRLQLEVADGQLDVSSSARGTTVTLLVPAVAA